MKTVDFLQALSHESVECFLVRGLAEIKRIANRPKDRLDIIALEKIKRGEDPNA